MKKAIINLSDIMRNENKSLSARDYLGTVLNPGVSAGIHPNYELYMQNRRKRAEEDLRRMGYDGEKLS